MSMSISPRDLGIAACGCAVGAVLAALVGPGAAVVVAAVGAAAAWLRGRRP